MSRTLQIASDFVVMSDAFEADVVSVSENLYAELDQTYGDFAGRSLISCHEFENDWPTWEVHPHGDEIVVLLSGSVEMILATSAGDQPAHLRAAGEFIVVPKGVWHTAKVSEPTRMLFITPGQATENREQPPGRSETP